MKELYLIIQLLILSSCQTIKLPFSTTSSPTTVDFTTVSQIEKEVCCPCENYTKKVPNNTFFSSAIQNEPKLFRLPDTISPVEYDLALKIDFIRFQKQSTDDAIGNVSIKVKVLRKTNEIFIHCGENIVIRSIVVRSTMDRGKPRNLVKSYTNNGLLNVTLETYLTVNETYYIDIMNFSAKYFLNQNSGILTRMFMMDNGTHDYILATQLEPDSARRIFPCFDEPKFKSIFNVEITTNVEFTILANTPEIECNRTPAWKTCKFEPSPIMSTYNLAFSINNFESIAYEDDRNITYRVWARKSQVNNSRVALNFTVEIFKIFEELLKFQFPLRKVDSLAIPNLKVFLGMEHFGLITYDESIIVQNEKFPLTFSRQLCALIISHEVSHQWFGNIVTTAWWSDLWLNEGFATYYSYRIAVTVLEKDNYYPLEKLALMNYLKHMDDFYSFPRGAIDSPVTEQAESKFNYLSYKKGFIIISMIEQIMDITEFDKSMIHYVRKYQYESVYPINLWQILSLYSNKNNLEKIMENWISKFGYPIVEVNITKNVSLYIGQKSSISFDRGNMLLNPKEYVTNEWIVPMFVMFGNSTFHSDISLVIFDKLNGSLELTDFNASNHWIVINSNYVSLFTAAYDDTIIDRLTTTLLTNHGAIPALSRAHILQDYYDSSKLQLRNNFKRFFTLLSYIKKETDPIPLVRAIELVDKLNGLFQPQTFYLTWQKFISTIFKPSFLKLVDDSSVQFRNQNATDPTLRRLLLNLACKLKLSYCTTITNEIIDRWLNDSLVTSDFDLLHISLCTYVQNDELGGNWIRLYKSKMFQSWDFIGVKYYAMGCSKVSWVIEKNIDIVFNVLRNLNERQNMPHVSSIGIDSIPADHLQAITPLGNILILSATYNCQNFQADLIRFTRIGLHLLCNAIIFEPHFPIPKSILEYAIPTLSHYNFIRQIYKNVGEYSEALLIDAKSNIDWMQKVDNLESYLRDYIDDSDSMVSRDY